jgi:bifunctional non-homologous end joining protein LigD
MSTQLQALDTSRRPKPSSIHAEENPDVLVEGRRLKLSNVSKVLYPKSGFTKGDVINYYVRVAPALLPHLRDRPLTLKRYPDGVEGEFFYEKKCPSYRPDWLDLAPVWSDRNQANIQFCMVNDLASLVWVANLADLELHTFLARSPDMQRPTMMVFDLDPGQSAGLLECLPVALRLRDLLLELKLKSFPKTSGSKGLQVYVPLNTPVTYEMTKPFAKAVAETLERDDPSRVVSKMSKSLRKGKVFVDWSQNDDFKTTVCVYSLRAKESPSVSTPITWEETERAFRSKSVDGLEFHPDDVYRRIDEHGDLFNPVLKLKQRIPRP